MREEGHGLLTTSQSKCLNNIKKLNVKANALNQLNHINIPTHSCQGGDNSNKQPVPYFNQFLHFVYEYYANRSCQYLIRSPSHILD